MDSPAPQRPTAKKPRAWDAKRITRFQRLWNGGEPYEKIAKSAGVKLSALKQTASMLRRRGVELVKRYPATFTTEATLNAWAAGKLAKQIAFEVGVNERALLERVYRARRAGDPRAVLRHQRRA